MNKQKTILPRRDVVENVIIAEDDLTIHPLLLSLVSRVFANADIYWNVSAEEAKKMILELKNNNKMIDLIISDLFLAGSDTGIDLLSSQESIETGAKKILITSAQSESIEDCYRHILPDTLFISKPINILKCVSFIKKSHHTNEINMNL